MNAMAIIGLLLGFALFVFLVARGTHMIFSVIVSGAVVALFSGMDMYTTLTDTFLGGVTSYIIGNAPVFVMGSVFGAVLGLTGAADSFAHWAIKLFGTKYVVTILMLVTAVLVYGGVNLYVIIFTLYPICLSMFKMADLPRRVIPGLVHGGAVIASMCPGAPQTIPIMICNSLGTNLMDCAVVGWIGGVFCIFFGPFIVNWLVKKYKKNGEGFVDREGDPISTEWDEKTATNPILALLCMVAMIFLVNFKWPSTGKAMPTTVAMLLGTLITLVVLFKWIDREAILKTVFKGIDSGVNVVLTVATVTGFGYIVKASPCFDSIIDFISTVGGNPLFGAIIGSAILGCACASASGGLGILLPAMQETWMTQTSVSQGALLRVLNAASGTIDTLPHNGFVNSIIGACGETIKSAYEAEFWVSVVMTTCVTIISTVLLLLFPFLQ